MVDGTRIEAVADDRSLDAAKNLIRDHFEAHSEAHDLSEVTAIINKLPEPYVSPLGGLWVAWEGSDAVGCVALQSLSSNVGEVKRMYVRPQDRGKGIARALGNRVIAEARARGFDRLRLGTLTTMQPAQNLYSSLGFEPIEPYRDVEFGNTLFYELDLRRVIIRPAAAGDAGEIAAIYNHYITNTIVTFEEEPVDASDIARRIAEVDAASLPWVVAEENGRVVGYAYATMWKKRIGYRFSVESTVYVEKDSGGRGIGTQLYRELFRLLEARGARSVIGGIALPNDASIALHEKFGMHKVAEFEEVGIKFGRWINVGYWQKSIGDRK